VLTGIHPILAGDLLAALDRLGHGDELVVADANFPAHRVGALSSRPRDSRRRRSSRRSARSSRSTGRARIGAPHGRRARRAARGAARAGRGRGAPADSVAELERFAFYDRAAAARLVVRTGELRPYGNLLLRKGVVNAYVATGAAR
jgi:L-fucose mutarotase